MDILAARKKAAEQASARPKAEPEVASACSHSRRRTRSSAGPCCARSRGEGRAPVAAAVSAAKLLEASPTRSGPFPRRLPTTRSNAAERRSRCFRFRLRRRVCCGWWPMCASVEECFQLTSWPNTPGLYSRRHVASGGRCCPHESVQGASSSRRRPGPEIQNRRGQSADEEVGLLVDRVTGLFYILPDDIKPAPENLEQGAEFLRGIVRKGDRLYILLIWKKAVEVDRRKRDDHDHQQIHGR